MKQKPYPKSLPPMPTGHVYLGKGGTFDVPKIGDINVFKGYRLAPIRPMGWVQGYPMLNGKATTWHYCALANSEIAILNGLAPTKDTKAKKSTVRKAPAKKAKSSAAPRAKTSSPSLAALKELATSSTGLVLEVGKEYLTRDGRTARVICTDLSAQNKKPVVAVIQNSRDQVVFYYLANGRKNETATTPADIVSEFPDFDWGVLPPWINYIAYSLGSHWNGYSEEPETPTRESDVSWEPTNENASYLEIPDEYAPTSTPTDWRKSLRVRPGYTEK